MGNGSFVDVNGNENATDAILLRFVEHYLSSSIIFDKNVRDMLRFTTANHTCFLVLFLELRALHLNLILT